VTRQAGIQCDRCGKRRTQWGVSHETLRSRAARDGWSSGFLDWPDRLRPFLFPRTVDRCGACTREVGYPRPIGPHYPNR